MVQAGASAAKREVRVCARGRSSSHATIRSRLIAAAMATCWRGVFATPQYRVRRSPKARTPCESVPSMPARCAYCAWPSALAYQALASATATSVLPPRHHQVPLGTAHLVVVPVDHKLLGAVRTLDLGLPALARTGGTAQVDVLLLAAGDQECCADIRRVDEVLAWRHVLLDERLLDRLRAQRLMHRGGRRVHVCEQMGGGGFAGFTDVDHVPGPLRVAFVAVARLAIVGRCDPFGR